MPSTTIATLPPSAESYDVLPDVESQSEKLVKERGSESPIPKPILQAAAGIPNLAITLAHKHVRLNPGQVMMEEFREDRRLGRLISVTRPVRYDESTMTATTFAVNPQGEVFAIEYISNATLLQYGIFDQVRNAIPNELAKKLASLIMEHNLQDLIGFAIIHRSPLMQGTNPSADMVLLESGVDDRADELVIYAVERSQVPDNDSVVTTAWAPSGTGLHGCTVIQMCVNAGIAHIKMHKHVGM